MGDAMIRHVWSVLCQKSVIDKDSNSISLYDIIEQLNVTLTKNPKGDAPLVLPIQFEIVSLWTRSEIDVPSKGEGRLIFTDPSDQVIRNSTLDIDLTSFIRTRTRQKISGLPLSKAGVYSFKIEFRNKAESEFQEVANLPLVVNLENKVDKPQ